MKNRVVFPVIIMVSMLLTAGEMNAGFKDTVRLLEASREGDITRVEEALNQGASANVRLKGYRGIPDGFTPLMLAARNGHAAVVKLLLKRGAIKGLRHPRSRKTALDFARDKNHKRVVTILRTYGNRGRYDRRSGRGVGVSGELARLLSSVPPEGGFISPGRTVKLKIVYDLSGKKDASMEVRFPHKMGDMVIDTVSLEKKRGEINLSYYISDYDLAHLKYGNKFRVELRIYAANPRFRKYRSVVQKKYIFFKNGQRKKTARQRKYMRGNSVSGRRVEVLYRDRIVTAPNGNRFHFPKGETLVYAEKYYLLRSGKLKKTVMAKIGKNSLRLKKGTYVYFNKKGYPVGGTLVAESPVISGSSRYVLKGGSSFEFLDNGVLSVGTLGTRSMIEIDRRKYRFHRGTRIGFYDDESMRILVTARTMKIAVPPKSYNFPPGTQIRYKKPERVYEVYNAVKPLRLFTGKRDVNFDRMHGIVYHDNGSVSVGLLRRNEVFLRGSVRVPVRRSVVEFHRDGSFAGGVLSRGVVIPGGEKNGLRISAGARIYFYESGMLKHVRSAKPFRVTVRGQRIYLYGHGFTQFYASGSLQYGTLARDQYLIVGGRRIFFKKRSLIKFHPNGIVSYGISSRTVSIVIDGKRERVTAGKGLYFDEKGGSTTFRRQRKNRR